jgi:hypothetical protein
MAQTMYVHMNKGIKKANFRRGEDHYIYSLDFGTKEK